MTATALSERHPSTSAWPELVPLDCPNLPSLPRTCLPAWAGDFASQLSVATETPYELAASMVLVACAAAAARRLEVEVTAGYREPCNLWIVAALPPGNRKSAVQTAAVAPLIEWERQQAGALGPDIARAQSERHTLEARAKDRRSKAAKAVDEHDMAALAQEAAMIEADLPEVPVAPQIWTSDATPERLGMLLADHGECMAWLSSEGGLFDLLQGRYSNGIPNLDLVLKAHSGDSERVDRAGREAVFLQCPRLSIGLSPQPDVLRGLAGKPGFRGRGLLARFLYFLPPSPLGFRSLSTEPMTPTAKYNYASGLKAMLDWPPLKTSETMGARHTVTLSVDARELWQDFALEIEREMRPGNSLEHVTDWAGKAPGAAARIAAVLHGIELVYGKPWEEEVSATTMARAIEFITVSQSHSVAAMDTMGADPTVASARHVWEWIRRGRRDEFKVRDAFNALRTRFPRVADLERALDVLIERGYVHVLTPEPKGRGRPSGPSVLVRPEIADTWK